MPGASRNLVLLGLAALVASASAATNGPCTGKVGICMASSACASAGGTTSTGHCPKDPANVLCCSFAHTPCNNQGGTCDWSCSGTAKSGLCPGPSGFKCCTGSKPPTSTPPPSSGGGLVGYADSHWNCANAACTSKVASGAGQSGFQCAEFVSRSLAAGGYIPGISSGASQSAFQTYKHGGVTYNLLWVSSKEGGSKGLEDLLKVLGWKTVAATSGNIHAGTVVFTKGSNGAFSHVAIGVGENLLDAHNNARYHVPLSFYGSAVNAVYHHP